MPNCVFDEMFDNKQPSDERSPQTFVTVLPSYCVEIIGQFFSRCNIKSAIVDQVWTKKLLNFFDRDSGNLQNLEEEVSSCRDSDWN